MTKTIKRHKMIDMKERRPVIQTILRWIIFTAGLGLVGGVSADTLTLHHGSGDAKMKATKLPMRGATMAQVLKAFGNPVKRHPPVGGSAPDRPPITRWDYPGFSVFFERNLVIDSVMPGHFPRIHHLNQLSESPQS